MKACLVIACLLGWTGLAFADFTAQVVPDPTAEPYRYVGRVRTGSGNGSGVVIGSDRTVVTAAHVMYQEGVNRWINEAEWQIRGDPEKTIVARNVRYFSAYGDAVRVWGSETNEAFSEDFAVLIGYESMSDVGLPQVSTNPASLVQGNSSKQIAGFPSGLYDHGHSNQTRMHQTGPFTGAFQSALGAYYTIEQVATGPGASGGGLWISEAGQWRMAGILVSGLETSLGDSRNAAGVVVLDARQMALLNEAIDLSGQIDLPRITGNPAVVVQGDWNGESSILIDYFSIPETWVTWEYADPRESPLVFRDVNLNPLSAQIRWDAATSWTALRIPPEATFWNNRVFRAEIGNDLGSVYTPNILFKYPGAEPLSLTDQTQPAPLSGNAEAILSATVSGFPPPLYMWEVNLQGKSGFQPVYETYGDHSPANRDTLMIPPQGGYYHNSVFRVRADNGNERVYSEPVKLQYTDLGEIQLELKAGPPALIHEGEEVTIEVANTTTLEGEMFWTVYDPFGMRIDQPPLNWTITPTNPPSIRVVNDGAPIHGYRIETMYSGHYYIEGEENPIRRDLEMVGPTFVLRAEGPPQLQRNLSGQFDPETGQLTLEAAWAALEPPEIDWQVSVDGGVRWHPWQSTTAVPLVGEARDWVKAGALFRARLENGQAGGQTTEPLSFSASASNFLERPPEDAVAFPRGGYGLTLHGGSLLAHSDFGNDTGTTTIRIYEREPAGWLLKKNLSLDGGSSLGSTQLEFLSDTQLLVALPFHNVGESSRAGALALIKRQANGDWVLDKLITAPQPRMHGFFGEDFAIDAGRLVVAERGMDMPARVHVFRIDNGAIEHHLSLPVGDPYDLNGWEVDIAGDWLHYATESDYYQYQRDESGNWIAGNTFGLFNAAPFLQPDGTYLFFVDGHLDEHAEIVHAVADPDQPAQWTSTVYQCPFGVGGDQITPWYTDSNSNWHGVKSRRIEWDFETGNVILFRFNHEKDALVMGDVSSAHPYEVLSFDLSETHLALMVRDTNHRWEDWTGWEAWVVPLEQVEPVALPQIGPYMEAEVESKGDYSRLVRLQYRQSIIPDIPVRIQSSSDMRNWTDVDLPRERPRVIQPDTDGDGKTSLIELELPLIPELNQIFYRALED